MTKPELRVDSAERNREEAGNERPERSSSRLRKVHSGGGKRGRRPSRVDRNAKLERSRQSARECRARKKQKYQLLEETVSAKEKQILRLREKLEKYKNFCQLMDEGEIPENLIKTLEEDAVDDEEEEEEENDAHPVASADQPFQRQSIGGDSSSEDDSD